VNGQRADDEIEGATGVGQRPPERRLVDPHLLQRPLPGQAHHHGARIKGGDLGPSLQELAQVQARAAGCVQDPPAGDGSQRGQYRWPVVMGVVRTVRRMLLEAQAHAVVGIPQVLTHADTMTHRATPSGRANADSAQKWTRKPLPASVRGEPQRMSHHGREGSESGARTITCGRTDGRGPCVAGPGRPARPLPALATRGLAEAASCKSRVPGQPTSPGNEADLQGVAVLSACDVWVVGWSARGPLIEHWNGLRWKVLASPGPESGEFSSVSAVSPASIWAVGSYADGAATKVLIAHWDGKSWRRAAGPRLAGQRTILTGIRAVSDRDAWAVGIAQDKALILHWNGTSWARRQSEPRKHQRI